MTPVGRHNATHPAALGRWALMLPVAALLLAAAPAAAPDLLQLQGAQQADLAAQRAAQAQSLQAAQQGQHLAAQRVEAAARLLVTETALADAQRRLDVLAQRRDRAEAQLATDARALAPLLPLLERLSLFPAETLLALPGAPQDAVRGVLVLGGLAQQLRARAAVVAAERAAVGRLQAQLDAALPALQHDRQLQQAQDVALDAALAQARSIDTAGQLQAEIASRRAISDAARAETVRQAIAALEAAARRRARQAARLAAAAAAAAAPAPTTPAATTPVTPTPFTPSAAAPVQEAPAGRAVADAPPATGWTLPAAGRVVRGFGAPSEDGPAAGITYQTPPGARVVAPCGGHVEFAAPFRSYGLLVIVACSGDVHVVLSGLARLDAAAGQAVATGEPLGIMSPSGGGALYLELRRGGSAVDPARYLRLAS